MAPQQLWTRGRRLPSAPALGLTAALAAALTAAGCTSAPVSSSASAATAQHTATPAITVAAARVVFGRYLVAEAAATSPKSASRLLSAETGVARATLAATLASHGVTESPVSSAAGTGVYSSSLNVEPGITRYAYGSPTFYLPEASGYPRFFVASVMERPRGQVSGDSAITGAGGSGEASGLALMVFSQADQGAPWLLAGNSALPTGVTVPPLARDASGYIPTVTPSAAGLLVQSDDAGPLQAAVVDDGPTSAAAAAAAAGPLTTGLYQDAAEHVTGMTPPDGDVYQWELQGVNDPEFALRTASGGALVFYTMALNTTVAVPDVINKANPIQS